MTSVRSRNAGLRRDSTVHQGKPRSSSVTFGHDRPRDHRCDDGVQAAALAVLAPASRRDVVGDLPHESLVGDRRVFVPQGVEVGAIVAVPTGAEKFSAGYGRQTSA